MFARQELRGTPPKSGLNLGLPRVLGHAVEAAQDAGHVAIDEGRAAKTAP